MEHDPRLRRVRKVRTTRAAYGTVADVKHSDNGQIKNTRIAHIKNRNLLKKQEDFKTVKD